MARAKIVFEFKENVKGRTGGSPRGHGGLSPSGRPYFMTRNSLTTFPIESTAAQRPLGSEEEEEEFAGESLELKI